ncbi:MAG: DNA-3-methyladenine glycosylase [Patescibacteria group bacterium]|nr:DNA-3-methyladenine glycosylase [Patescibacteria group bacterium]MDE1945886.1 DNA-3-methyladenine glycosylase [Patescibacteria group bacterium]
MKGKLLGKKFFNRDADAVACDLIGKFIVRKTGGGEVAAMITETEAYVGPHDLASHASKGRTERTKVMFGAPGTLYVYLVYGMHLMLNIVTREEGYPAAVLVRAVTGATGPGRAAKFLHITKNMNGKLAGRKTGLWIKDWGIRIRRGAIRRTPRVGVDYAGPVWAKKKLRFILDESGR